MNYLSTEQVPRQQRLQFLHDFVGRQVARRQFQPLTDEISIEMNVTPLSDGVILAKARYSPIIGKRTADMLDDGHDSYLLTIHKTDCEISIEGRPPLLVRKGDMMLVHEAVHSTFHLPRTEVIVVSLGFRDLTSRLPRLGSQPNYCLPGDAQGVGLLSGYLGLLADDPATAKMPGARAASHLCDLAAFAVGASMSADADADRTSIGRARLDVAKRAILGRVREPDLKVTEIARQQGVTPRYLQRLFETEGSSFSTFLRDARLDLAFDTLSNAEHVGAGISTVAYDCGFSDLSHFNRSFRKRFDRTPSDVRAAALRRRS